MRKFTAILAVHVLLCTAFAQAPAQPAPPRPAPTPPPQQQQQQSPPPAAGTGTQTDDDDDDVVRITVNLVQMDVVVTDKKGRQVTDLRAEDFEIFEDKRPQQITNFSYVSNTPAGAAVQPEAQIARAKKAADKFAPPVPPARLRPEEVRRTIALVVDDLGLSFTSVHQARQALKKFVDEQMQPHDLVAIIRTSAGVGALQQFTSDKRQLYAAIERVRWYAAGRGGVGVFQPVEASLSGRAAADGSGDETRLEDAVDDELNEFREELFAVGTLGAINYVVRGMHELPGRKSVVLLSDGFAINMADGEQRERLLEALRRLTDLATRASVVIYTVDARGLVYTGPTAEDNLSGMSPQQINGISSQRSRQIYDTQEGLIHLARETGGLAFYNSNDVNGGVRKVLEDQSGFYLIGYRPAGETFDRRFHKLSAKVKNRPDLKVRTRSGFYGVPDDALRPVRRTKQQQIMAALMSPFSAGDIDLRLTAFFTATPQAQAPYVVSQMHLDIGDLKFTQLPDGQHEAVIELIGVAFGANGLVVDQGAVTQTIRLRADVYERAVNAGIVYNFNIPVKKAGAYQLRMAVRDTATGRIGSASQFIEVPDLKKQRIALSGVVASGSTPTAAAAAAPTAAPTAAPADARAVSAGLPAEGVAAAAPDPEAGMAVRRFRHGMALDFAYIVFNARPDKATKLPHILTQLRLFRDGKLVYTGQEKPLAVAGLTDPRRIVIGGRLYLGTDLAPGDYILQVIATDALAKPNDKRRTTTQWTDFEIVKPK